MESNADDAQPQREEIGLRKPQDVQYRGQEHQAEGYDNRLEPEQAQVASHQRLAHLPLLVQQLSSCRLVAELVNREQFAGKYSVSWNGSNQSSGMYLVQMLSPDFTKTQKILLLK